MGSYFALVFVILFACLSGAANAQQFGAASFLNTNATTDSGNDTGVTLATDGAVWVAAWESTEEFGGPAGPDQDILISRSMDGGLTWGAPFLIHVSAIADGQTPDEFTSIATDGAGGWMAIWHSYFFTPGSRLLASYSSNDGAIWSLPLPVDSTLVYGSGIAKRPDVATDSEGTWLVTWEHYVTDTSTDPYVVVARSTDSGLHWTDHIFIDGVTRPAGTRDSAPQLVVVGDDWVLVWVRYGASSSDGEILVSRSTDDGDTWSSAVTINTSSSPDVCSSGIASAPELVRGDDTLLAIWSDTESAGGTTGCDSDIFVSRSTDDGVTWSAPLVINATATTDGPTGASDRVPQLAYDGSDRWLAAWDTPTGISTARSLDDGVSWTATQDIAAAGFGPLLATNGLGRWVLAWASAPPGGDFDIVHAIADGFCGDFLMEGPEECDDGNVVGEDGCAADCSLECGNAVLNGIEECDDGNRADGDGCAGACVVEQCFACAGEPSVCTADDGGACDDADPCTVGETCLATVCAGGGDAPDGTSCSDSTLCNGDESCIAGVCETTESAPVCTACRSCQASVGCAPSPEPGCHGPLEGLRPLLLLKERLDDLDKRRLSFKWLGEMTALPDFGNPETQDTYIVCLSDQSSGQQLPFMCTSAAGGAVCGNDPCWKATKNGFVYKDRNQTQPNSFLSKMTLKAGADGKAKIIIKAKGANIPLPQLQSLLAPMTVRVDVTSGGSWEAVFPPQSVIKQTDTLLKARLQ